jgi:hypothetical protein
VGATKRLSPWREDANADGLGTVSAEIPKYWEIVADNLSKAGWSWGCVSAIDSNGRTIWIVDAHRDDARDLDRQIRRNHHEYLFLILSVVVDRCGASPDIRLYSFRIHLFACSALPK